MKEQDVVQMWQALNEASGEAQPLPAPEVIETLLSLDASEMAAFENGTAFYASDKCAYCDCESGYGNVWCGTCEGGRHLLNVPAQDVDD